VLTQLSTPLPPVAAAAPAAGLHSKGLGPPGPG
jgi:hypothetical protein